MKHVRSRLFIPFLQRILLMTVATVALLMTVVPAAEAGHHEADEIVHAMVKAHGGLEPWRSTATVSFQDSLMAPGAPAPLVTRVTVEQGSRRAYLEIPGTEMRLSWDGEKAWSENWGLPYPPRMVALLNYYFANLPWLTQDPGVELSYEGKERLWEDPTEYLTVRMTFGEGVGDTPDDYYVLYIHPETHELKACRYIVTYAAILPEGVEALPEHILVYDAFTEVDGLKVPTAYTSYNLDHSVFVKYEVSDWSFDKPFDTTRMTMAEGAVIDTSPTSR